MGFRSGSRVCRVHGLRIEDPSIRPWTVHSCADRQIVGSSTACIASLDCSAGELEVANLGDSGALVVQPNGHVCLETKEQQHYFNCQMPRSAVSGDILLAVGLVNPQLSCGRGPYQLVCVPPRRSGGSAMSSQGDLPASSDKYATDVRPGDATRTPGPDLQAPGLLALVT